MNRNERTEIDDIFSEWDKLPTAPRPDDLVLDCCGKAIPPVAFAGEWQYEDEGRVVGPGEACSACIRAAAESARVAFGRESRAKQFAAFLESVPLAYRSARPDDIPEAIRGQITRWLSSADYPICVLHSRGKGTGKTHAAYALAISAMRSGHQAMVINWPDFMASARVAAGTGGDMPTECYIAFEGVLVIDDLGAGKETPFAVGELYRIIATREAWKRKTLITTNLPMSNIAGRLDDRVASRLSGGVLVEMDGADRRIEAAREWNDSGKGLT